MRQWAASSQDVAAVGNIFLMRYTASVFIILKETFFKSLVLDANHLDSSGHEPLVERVETLSGAIIGKKN
jgi:hypothetical protein